MISNAVNDGLIVAVDGPSGAGKSTICRTLAQQLGAKYLDTGAMYRIATLHVLQQGIDPTDTAAVIAATAQLPIAVNDDPTSKEVLLDGVDVQEEIRGRAVTNSVSAVSAVPEVRSNLVAMQQQLVRAAHRCIVDGRDIGTQVLKDAPLKIFLTASAEVRAMRRHEQDLAAGRPSDYQQTLEDVQRRDKLDASRPVSPLVPADDATIVDTSDMTLEQAITAVAELIDQSALRYATKEQ